MSLWNTVKEFARDHPEHIAEDNALRFMVDDPNSSLQDSRYNLCHCEPVNGIWDVRISTSDCCSYLATVWSNFEIADMRFWRSKAYSDFFDYLDSKGGFFYERWGDAPVHSIGGLVMRTVTKSILSTDHTSSPLCSCISVPAQGQDLARRFHRLST